MVSITSTTLPTVAKIGAGKVFTGKSYGRYPDGLPTVAKALPIFGAYIESTAEDMYDTVGTVPEPSYDTTGFKRIIASADTKKIYVDGRANGIGSDFNDGLTPETPVLTYAAAIDLQRAGYPDHIMLRRGSVFSVGGLLDTKPGRSVDEPAVIGWYGADGGRPKFARNNRHSLVADNHRYLIFKGVDLSCPKVDPFDAQFAIPRLDHRGNTEIHSGISIYGQNIGDLYFDDCRLDLGEILAQSSDGYNGPYFFNRCIFTGAYKPTSSYNQLTRPSNMYASKTDGWHMLECVMDHGGWNEFVPGAGANMYNHNGYLQYGNVGSHMVWELCFSTRASAHGVQFRSGGSANNNFFGRNPISLSMGNGYADRPMLPNTRVHAYNNVISEGRTMRRGIAHCTGPNVCTTAVWGLDITVNNPAGAGNECDYQMHGNLISMIAPEMFTPERSGESMSRKFFPKKAQSGSIAEIIESGNVGFKFETDTQGEDAGYPDPTRTLGRYCREVLGVADGDFDRFMETVLNRPVNSWRAAYSAREVNDWMRGGFGMAEEAYAWSA